MRGEFRFAFGDPLLQISTIAVFYALCGGHQLLQSELRIGDRAERRLIVASDFSRVDVDMDQFGRRHLECEAWIPGTGVRFRQPRSDRNDQVRIPAEFIRNGNAPESGLAGQPRMIVRQAALTHQRVGNGYFQGFRQLGQESRGAFGQYVRYAAAGIEHRAFRLGQRLDDLLCDGRIKHGLGHDRRRLGERIDIQVRREMIHRDVDEHGAGTAAHREVECALDHPGKILHPVHAIDALAERTVDLVLIRVHVHGNFLVGMPAEEIRRHVTRDHDHRNRIERSVWPRPSSHS